MTAHGTGREPRSSWAQDLASGREPGWTPLACGALALAGWLGPRAGLPADLALVAFAGAYVAGGAVSAVRSIRSLAGRRLDIDLLMLVSAGGAAVIGEWAEGASLLFLFSLANALEARALARTTRAITALMALRPDEASRLDGDGVERRVPAEELAVGDRVRVRPGERIPADGTIAAGTTALDQAALTGESLPVDKGPGDPVFAGSINEGGTIDVTVGKAAGESTLARIIHLVEEAREAKAPTQRFIDRFEQGYAATVLFAAAVAATVPLAFGEPFAATFYRAMTLLVVASPCAIVISTPATLLSALAHAARHGLLFKGGAPLEALTEVEVFAFDKTGTLTQGKPEVVEVVPFGGADSDAVLALAAGVERLSEHPLAQAVVAAAMARGLALPEAAELRNFRGRGVLARVAGERVWVGSPRFLAEEGMGPVAAEDLAALDRLRAGGATAVVVASDRLAGALAIGDRPRPGAAAAVAALGAAGVRRTLLLTGDHPAVARSVAASVGVDEWQADLLPEEKVAVLRERAAAGERVAMVGDGVNDAPALAVAHVGIAMGISGTDAALETADLVLVRDDLGQLAYAVRLARRAQRVVRQNLALASSVIAVLVVVNLVHGLPLPLGVVGHEGSTLLVVANGLRLLRPLRGAAAQDQRR